MLRKVSAMKARKNLGRVMNKVALRGDDYIIARSGKALLAIISFEKYQVLQKDRELALHALGSIGDKIGNEDPEMVEKTMNYPAAPAQGCGNLHYATTSCGEFSPTDFATSIAHSL